MSEWQETVIGDLPIEWNIQPFSEIIEDGFLSYGVVQPGPHKDQNSVPIIRVQNIRNGVINAEDIKKIDSSIEAKYQRTRLEGGELLVTVVGSVGETAIVPDVYKGWNVARAVSVSRISNHFDKNFIKYCFSSENIRHQIYGRTNDTVQPTLNLSSLKGILFPIPSLPEQKAITAVLASLDDKIDLLHRQNKTLEALAQTLFRHWFIDGAEDDWEDGTVNDLVEIQSGFAFKSKTFEETGKYRLVTIKNVQDGYLDLSRTSYLNKIPSKIPDYCYLQPGDILLSLTGNVGRCCLVDEKDLLLNQRVAKLHPRKSRDWAFTYCLFRRSQMNQELIMLARGTAQLNLSPIETGQMDLSIPDLSTLENFSQNATPILDKVMGNKRQIQTLEKLRDTLLPKLMSGEVRVRL